METKSSISDDLYAIIDHNTISVSEENFFGVNLNNAPDASWEEEVRKDNSINHYLKKLSNDISCELVISQDHQKCFHFYFPKSYENFINIGFIVERDIVKKKRLNFKFYLNDHNLDFEDFKEFGIGVLTYKTEHHMISLLSADNSKTIELVLWLNFEDKKREKGQNDWLKKDFLSELAYKSLSKEDLTIVSKKTIVEQETPAFIREKHSKEKTYNLTEEIWQQVKTQLEEKRFVALDPYDPSVISELKTFAYNCTNDDPVIDDWWDDFFNDQKDECYHDVSNLKDEDMYRYSKYSAIFRDENTTMLGIDTLLIFVIRRFNLDNQQEAKDILDKVRGQCNNNFKEFEGFLVKNRIPYSKFTNYFKRVEDRLVGLF